MKDDFRLNYEGTVTPGDDDADNEVDDDDKVDDDDADDEVDDDDDDV